MYNKTRKVALCLVLMLGLAGCEHGLPYESSSTADVAHKEGYVSVQEGRLYYQVFGQGTPMIVLHGGPGLDQSYLLPQMLELAKHNQVVFYDQRGSGKSMPAVISKQRINVSQFVADLEDLRQALGYEKFVIVGHSWGGRVAMEYAVRYPEALSGMILLNSSPATYEGQKGFMEGFSTRTAQLTEQIKPLFDENAFARLDSAGVTAMYKSLYASAYFYDQQKVEELSLNFGIDSARSGIKVLHALSKETWLQPQFDLRGKLLELNIPTLVVHGDSDIIPLWTAKEIQEAIPGAQLIVLKNCGHFPYVEQPQDLFDAINSFVSQL